MCISEKISKLRLRRNTAFIVIDSPTFNLVLIISVKCDVLFAVFKFFSTNCLKFNPTMHLRKDEKVMEHESLSIKPTTSSIRRKCATVQRFYTSRDFMRLMNKK